AGSPRPRGAWTTPSRRRGPWCRHSGSPPSRQPVWPCARSRWSARVRRPGLLHVRMSSLLLHSIGRSGRLSLSVLTVSSSGANRTPRKGQNSPSPDHLGIALLANAEGVDEAAVTIHALRLQVIEEAPPLADQLEQPAARVVV